MKSKQKFSFYEKRAKQYEAQYESPFWKLYKEITWSDIQKHLPRKKGALILDAGGGTGYWSRRLAKLGYRVICNDISPKMLEVGEFLAKKERLQGRIQFEYGDVTSLKHIKTGTFDMVVCEGDPVSYCGNAGKAVKELGRVAKRGARIVISVDSFYQALRRMIVANDTKGTVRLLKTRYSAFPGMTDHAPQYNFEMKELKTLCKSAGLTWIGAIGKPVFAHLIARDEIEPLLNDRRTFSLILSLEKRFNSDPSIAGMGGHLQVTAKKK